MNKMVEITLSLTPLWENVPEENWNEKKIRELYERM